jgi:hypothetical protein
MRYAIDRARSDLYLPAMRAICGPLLLVNADDDRDMNEATDLMLFKARDLRIAARVRDAWFAGRYPGEFTIRYSRPSGAKTEWDKIVHDGFGDWLVYGVADAKRKGHLAEYMVLDLDVFRVSAVDMDNEPIRNRDGTTFIPYRVEEFPDELVIACSDNDEARHAA